ncbi:malto-oligosyltrehalose synthase [Candidatus Pantoea multigeneris]|uniref:Malto-oligosyltrehalose synthase n=1 Tax=Candidatus Pantoea multigeneris TaxID=2608357 RepID=A0ABX0RE73_9GAMM|nr:malto-oligosyltrehalose synthase [Pantoea multigeneris]NIF21969.1 malto-oligosyltrehalose synthase [Pantoea multigeneris]
MTIPCSTYRLQLRNGMTFDRATALIPYWQSLGISHLYLSPVFTAPEGSTHGYDVSDANEIDPSIGGRAGFDRLVAALHQAGLALILDIVPNHMAASLENPWWRDVIEYGEQSRYAHYFDIDWSRRLTLPFLGDSFEAVLAAGEIRILPDPNTGKPVMAYFDNYYPLTPGSWQGREQEVLALTDIPALAALHAQQPWQLMSWRDARRELSYRRFFEITGLVGVRVEDDKVFDATHQLILELVHSGAVAGLRIDHIDGLADPQGYVTRLRQACGADCYITVEKITAEGEQLPEDWPVAGTTGYEFIATLAQALVDNSQVAKLQASWQQISQRKTSLAEDLRAAKQLMVTRNFEGEFTTLVAMVLGLAHHEHARVSEGALRDALRELLIAFPVYRTYGTAQGLPSASARLLSQVVAGIQLHDRAALDFIVTVLSGAVSPSAESIATQFRLRFQQLTGPLMAKSVEDTLFFRQSALLALNEVGAEPLPQRFSVANFHQRMQERLTAQPQGISTTATHDTKRGEDARARLYSLSEAPEQWAESVNRWRQQHQLHVIPLSDGPAPEPEVEWMLYQALAGIWPNTPHPEDPQILQTLEARFLPFVEKALREAKLRTDWSEQNAEYETAVLNYARQLLSPLNHAFLQDFHTTLQPFIEAGRVNSLAQSAIKLTAPGVPDIYQGSEVSDLSLVDPDNRREPDFPLLQHWLTQPDARVQEGWRNGAFKQQFTARLLQLRQSKPELFRDGDYQPLALSGPAQHLLVAYARSQGNDSVIVIVPRLPLHATRWEATAVNLPAALAFHHYREWISGVSYHAHDRFPLDSFNPKVPLVLVRQN